MTKNLIGYKQENGCYVYVNSINDYGISVTLNVDNAIDFINEKITKTVCEYLNIRDNKKTYLSLSVNVTVTETRDKEVDTDVTTSK